MRIAIPGIRSIGLSSAERWLGKMTGTACRYVASQFNWDVIAAEYAAQYGDVTHRAAA